MGTPLLLTHGMGGNAHWWDAVAPALKPVFRPAALDFSGHGESPWKADGLYDAGAFAADIEAARLSLSWEKMTLCGHSMGARVALEYARLHPERLLGLIVVDFLPEFYQRRTRRYRAHPQPLYPNAERMISSFHLQPPGTLLPGEELREFAWHCIRPAEGGYTWKFDWRAFRFPYEPIWPILRQIRVPTLVVRGQHSTVLGRGDFERVLRELPGAAGVEIDRAHHHVPLDTPLELAAAMTAFLMTLNA